MPRLFAPTARQLNLLIPIGLVALGYALYLRYLVIQLPWVGLACDAGLPTWQCFSRGIAMALFKHWVFGAAALGAAVLHLIRPSLVMLTIGVVASAFGIVLFNVGGAGLAVGLLILSFARPIRETR